MIGLVVAARLAEAAELIAESRRLRERALFVVRSDRARRGWQTRRANSVVSIVRARRALEVFGELLAS